MWKLWPEMQAVDGLFFQMDPTKEFVHVGPGPLVRFEAEDGDATGGRVIDVQMVKEGLDTLRAMRTTVGADAGIRASSWVSHSS